MERRCSCAAPQIFSAEACMFFSQKPDFRAFYSPIHLPHHKNRILAATPGALECPVHKIHGHKPNVPGLSLSAANITRCKSTTYKGDSDELLYRLLQGPKSTGRNCRPSEGFKESPAKLEAQHINSCSQVIHN